MNPYRTEAWAREGGPRARAQKVVSRWLGVVVASRASDYPRVFWLTTTLRVRAGGHFGAHRAATLERMGPLSRRSTLGVVLVALVACLAARGVCAQETTSATRTRYGYPTTSEFAERASAETSARARDASAIPAGRQGPRAIPTALQRAPRAIVSGALRLCGGAPVPAQLFLGGPNDVVCLEQRLAGVTPRQVRRRSLDVTGVNVTFDGVPIHPASVGAPELFYPRANARGLFDWVNLGDDERDQSDASAADDAEVVARFNLTLAGLADVPDGTAGTLASTVSVLPAGRYYYEIVWYELELVVPTFYSGAVETIIREGEKLGLDDYEIDYRIDNLVEGEATFFPCTNFIAGPFCEEAGITA